MSGGSSVRRLIIVLGRKKPPYGGLLIGAVEKTRTSTRFLPQRPQRCASTNSATTARSFPAGRGVGLADMRRGIKGIKEGLCRFWWCRKMDNFLVLSVSYGVLVIRFLAKFFGVAVRHNNGTVANSILKIELRRFLVITLICTVYTHSYDSVMAQCVS